MSTQTPCNEVEAATDLIVVGGGGAGLAAAVAAASRGIAVVVLEAGPALGGTTLLSVGSMTAAGTRIQRAAGVSDSADMFLEDMRSAAGDGWDRDNPTLRCVFAAEAGQTIDWLERLGVVFAGPFPEPPNRANRMHNAVPGPRVYIAALERAATRAGARILVDAPVRHLQTDDRGDVVGVVFEEGGKPVRLLARRGVVLATGDFSGNQPMRDRFLQDVARIARPVNAASTGDGHELASRAGAVLLNMDAAVGPQLRFQRGTAAGLPERLPTWRWLGRMGAVAIGKAPAWMLRPIIRSLLVAHMSPSPRLFQEGAVLIDRAGNRLDETEAAAAVARADGSSAFIILDDRLARLFSKHPYFISTAPSISHAFLGDYEKARPELVRRGPTVAALARELGISAAVLEASVRSLSDGPFVALGPVHGVLTVTDGSVRIDERCRVLRDDGSAVDGLYAVGTVGLGGMLMKGHGTRISWAMTSGRIAGETVARRVPAARVALREPGHPPVARSGHGA
ncbi:MAG: FAD-dependent oxidoreductase [Lautropia sp.]